MVVEKIIQTGAEAVLIRKDELVLKRRVKKGYRFPELDEKIRKLRTRSESKLLARAGKLIPTPRVLKVDEKLKEIDIEFLDGLKLSEHLDNLGEWENVCRKIGSNIAKLHDADIIHGDLTTSNMILINNDIYFIDYGLGFSSSRIEDKAVDLHLIKQALEAKHFSKFEDYFKIVLEGYGESKNFDKVMKQFEKVEKRGRYKNQY